MLERCYKIAGIAIVVVMVITLVAGPGVGAVVWMAQVDSNVERLQSGVEELQSDVEELQSDMDEALDLLRVLADDLRDLRTDFNNHGHENGTVVVRPARAVEG